MGFVLSHVAARICSFFQLIQVHGADVDMQDQNNFKIIQKAIAMGNFDVFVIIFSHKIQLALQTLIKTSPTSPASSTTSKAASEQYQNVVKTLMADEACLQDTSEM